MADKYDTKGQLKDDFRLDNPTLDNMDSEFDKDLRMESDIKGRRPARTAVKLVSHAFKSMGKGALRGIKYQLQYHFPSANIALNDIRSVGSSIRQMRDETMKEMDPELRSLKRSTARLIARGDQYIPTALQRRLKSATEDWNRPSATGQTEEEARDAVIAESINAMVSKQTAVTKVYADEDRADRYIDKVVQKARFKKSQEVMSSIDRTLLSIDAFNRKAHLAFLKKGLELKYKHLFVARDTLGVMKQMTSIIEIKLEEIKKNTGLPEYMKEQGIEGAVQREKLAFRNRYGKAFANIRRNIMTNIVNNVLFGVSSASMAAEGLADGADAVAEMGELSPSGLSPGATKAKHMIGAGGGLLGMIGGGLLSRSVLRKMNVQASNIDELFANLKTKAAVKMRLVKESLINRGGTLGYLADMIGQGFGENPRIGVNNVEKLNEAASFTNAAHRSIVEIIPGFQAKQLKVLEDIAYGGDHKIQKFNDFRSTFTTVDQYEKDFWNRTMGRGTYRTNNAIRAVGTVEGALRDKNAYPTDFKKIEADMQRLMINLATKVRAVDPIGLRNYLISLKHEGHAYPMRYITDLAIGLKYPEITIGTFTRSLFLDNEMTKVDVFAVTSIENNLFRQMYNDEWLTMMDTLIQSGSREVFSKYVSPTGFIDLDTISEKFLEGGVSSETQQSASDYYVNRRTKGREETKWAKDKIDSFLKKIGISYPVTDKLAPLSDKASSGYTRVQKWWADLLYGNPEEEKMILEAKEIEELKKKAEEAAKEEEAQRLQDEEDIKSGKRKRRRRKKKVSDAIPEEKQPGFFKRTFGTFKKWLAPELGDMAHVKGVGSLEYQRFKAARERQLELQKSIGMIDPDPVEDNTGRVSIFDKIAGYTPGGESRGDYQTTVVRLLTEIRDSISKSGGGESTTHRGIGFNPEDEGSVTSAFHKNRITGFAAMAGGGSTNEVMGSATSSRRRSKGKAKEPANRIGFFVEAVKEVGRQVGRLGGEATTGTDSIVQDQLDSLLGFIDKKAKEAKASGNKDAHKAYKDLYNKVKTVKKKITLKSLKRFVGDTLKTMNNIKTKWDKGASDDDPLPTSLKDYADKYGGMIYRGAKKVGSKVKSVGEKRGKKPREFIIKQLNNAIRKIDVAIAETDDPDRKEALMRMRSYYEKSAEHLSDEEIDQLVNKTASMLKAKTSALKGWTTRSVNKLLDKAANLKWEDFEYTHLREKTIKGAKKVTKKAKKIYKDTKKKLEESDSWNQFTDDVSTVTSNIKNSRLVSTISDNLKNVAKGASNYFKGFGERVAGKASGNLPSEFWQNFVARKHATDDVIVSILTDIAANGQGGLIGKISNGIGKAFGGTMHGLGAFTGGMAKMAGYATGGLLRGIGGVISGTGKGIGGAIGGTAKGIGYLGGGFLRGTGALTGGLMSMLGSVTSSTIGALGSTADAVYKAFNKGRFKPGAAGTATFIDVYRADKREPGSPLLSAAKQRAGVQFADGTKVKATYEITEPVFDPKTGETLISKYALKKGLVDVYGKTIYRKPDDESKGFMGKLFAGTGNKAMNASLSAFSLLARFLGMDIDLIKSIVGGTINIAKKGIKSTWNWLTGQKEKDKRSTNDFLAEILSFLTDKLKSIDEMIELIIKEKRRNKKRRKLDRDGDGDRDGSYEDQRERKLRLNRERRSGKKSDDEDDDGDDNEKSITDIIKSRAKKKVNKIVKNKVFGVAKKGLVKAAVKSKAVGLAAKAGLTSMAGTATSAASSGLASVGGMSGLAAMALPILAIGGIGALGYGAIKGATLDQKGQADVVKNLSGKNGVWNYTKASAQATGIAPKMAHDIIKNENEAALSNSKVAAGEWNLVRKKAEQLKAMGATDEEIKAFKKSSNPGLTGKNADRARAASQQEFLALKERYGQAKTFTDESKQQKTAEQIRAFERSNPSGSKTEQSKKSVDALSSVATDASKADSQTRISDMFNETRTVTDVMRKAIEVLQTIASNTNNMPTLNKDLEQAVGKIGPIPVPVPAQSKQVTGIDRPGIDISKKVYVQ